MEPKTDYIVSVAPHLKAEEDITGIMQWVCIALAPAFGVAFYTFGWWAMFVTFLCVGACIVTEYVCQKLRCVPVTVNDWSAVVTGLLLAAVLPPNVSWWVPVVGGVVAIGVAKHAFGGLGNNIWNPALLGRAFLQVAVPTQLNGTEWPYIPARVTDFFHRLGVTLNGSFQHYIDVAKQAPQFPQSAADKADLLHRTAENMPDAISQATMMTRIGMQPLSGVDPHGFSWPTHLGNYWDLVARSVLGVEPGCIAETSALFLLLGGLLLLWRKIITWEIPVVYIATVGLLGWILPPAFQLDDVWHVGAWFSGPWALHLAGGGLMIGAFFMATDMVTSPISFRGRLVFGIGCGVLTAVIRLYAGYPEGVCYSILIMNTCVPLIDAWTRPAVFGARRAGKAT